MNLVDALRDEHVFGRLFPDLSSWRAWVVALKAIFALDMDEGELELFREHTARTRAPERPCREAWFVVGRRGGKSRMAALVTVFLASVRDYSHILARGESAVAMCVAQDRRQARVVLDYVRGILHAVPMLESMIARDGKESIELTNGVRIEVHTASFRAVRGYTVVSFVGDETAFWRSDESANPDSEILNAVRPAMATVPGALMLAISSPYSRRGELWKAYRRYYGRDEDDVLVWQASSRAMNPTLPEAVVESALAEDEASARAEYLAEFRRDIEGFVPLEVVEKCVVRGRREIGFVDGFPYTAFVDPSGGSSDSMTLAIAHRSPNDGPLVVDCVFERKPPFSPQDVVTQFAGKLREYGLSTVRGDRYAGEWPREQFRTQGIHYVTSERTKSEIYGECLPLLTGQRVELLDEPRLIQQLVNLERRTSRSGKDSIDHGPGGHDDVANSVAGALVESALEGQGQPFVYAFG